MKRMWIPVWIMLSTFILMRGAAGMGGHQSLHAPAHKDTSQIPYMSGCDLEVYPDWSLSTNYLVYGEVARDLLAVIPGVCADWGVIRIAICPWDSDGWSAQETFSREVKWQEGVDTTIQIPDDEIIEVMKHQIDKYRQAQKTQALEKIRQLYSAGLNEILHEIHEKELLPPPDHKEPPCTDFNGLHARIARAGAHRLQLALELTDGKREKCEPQLLPTVAPETPTALVVVLLPAKGDKAPYELFEERMREMQKALPWAEIIPYFNVRYLGDAFRHALEKWKEAHLSRAHSVLGVTTR